MKYFRYNKAKKRIISGETEEKDALKLLDKDNVWIEYTGNLTPNLFGLDLDLSELNENEYAQVFDSGDMTILKIGYMSREDQLKYVYMIIFPNSMISVHDADVSPIKRFTREIQSIALDEGVQRFNDFIISHILDEITIENANAIGRIEDSIDELEKLAENNEDISSKIISVREHIRMISKILLFEHSLVTDIKHGKGVYINAKNLSQYCDDIMNDIYMLQNLKNEFDKSIQGLVQLLNTRKLGQHAESTENLNVAIEFLTRAGVLLVIPNSIFTLWPTLPFTPNEVVFMGMKSWELELFVSFVLIVITQLMISWFYKNDKEVSGTKKKE